MSDVLVTGASGFIGSHLVERLVRDGHHVRVLLRDSAAPGNIPPTLLPELECVAGDLRDAGAVNGAVYGAEIVFHLGAQISVPYSIEHPVETCAVNIQGTLNILQAMRQHQTPRGVIISTCDVYGTPQYAPVNEKHPIHPQSPYAASKASAEALALSYHRSFGTPITILRLFNTFGPRQSTRAVIPTIIRQALTPEVSAITLGALHPKRDYTYVADMVRAFVLAGRESQAVGQAINIGSGQMISIGEIAAQIVQLLGRDLPVFGSDPGLIRASEVLWMQANNQQAREVLGWKPETSLIEGMQRTIEAMQAEQK